MPLRLLGLEVKLVAIERPDGLLIERLLDAGLRTDSHRYRILVPDTDQTKALRALSRARADLVGTRVAVANELRAQLGCFWPGAANVFSEIDSPIALAFLKQYPTPAAARGLGEQRLARFLAHHSYSGHKPPASCSAACAMPPRDAPGRSRPAHAGRSCWPWLRRLSRSSPKSRSSPTRSAARSLSTPTARRSASCSRTPPRRSPPRRCSPRSATAASATPPSKPSASTAGNPQSLWSPANQSARGTAGHATTASGKRSARSRTAAATTTPGPRTLNTQRAIACGASHPHAIRILGRAWCGIIWRLWRDYDTYDTNRHTPYNASSPPRPRLLDTSRGSPIPTSSSIAPAGRRRHRRLPAGQSAKRVTARPTSLTHPART